MQFNQHAFAAGPDIQQHTQPLYISIYIQYLAAAGRFLEHAEVHANLYGTSKQAVQDTLTSGKAAVLDVDVQGARQIRKAGVPALLVFVAPPSLEELERRLRGRGTETPVSMERRIQNARDEISRCGPGLFGLSNFGCML